MAATTMRETRGTGRLCGSDEAAAAGGPNADAWTEAGTQPGLACKPDPSLEPEPELEPEPILLLPSLKPAREGRLQQRYSDDGVRFVAGCVPFRRTAPLAEACADSGSASAVEILLISSSKSDAWILPKGGWEVDETEMEAAAREAYEEAGVRGMVHRQPLGAFGYTSKNGEVQSHVFYALEVREVLTEWPEQTRARKWFPLNEALTTCTRETQKDALEALVERLNRPSAPASSRSSFSD